MSQGLCRALSNNYAVWARMDYVIHDEWGSLERMVISDAVLDYGQGLSFVGSWVKEGSSAGKTNIIRAWLDCRRRFGLPLPRVMPLSSTSMGGDVEGVNPRGG